MVHNPLKIGHLIKAFGKNGQMRVDFHQNLIDDIMKAGYILANINGEMVPFFIENFDSQSDLIKFEDINGPQEARDLSDTDIFLLDKDVHSLTKKERINNNLLKDFRLFDQNKHLIGVIKGVMEMPKQILLQIIAEKDGSEKLIPLHDDLILDLNSEQRTIQLFIAEGLLEL